MFGHTTLSYKVTPRTEVEKAAKIIKEVINMNVPLLFMATNVVSDDDSFVTMGKQNRTAFLKPFHVSSGNVNNNSDMDQGNIDDVINIQEEFDNNVWPDLKSEVHLLMVADGIVADMKPEFEIDAANEVENVEATDNNVFNDVDLQRRIRCDYMVTCWILNLMVTELSDAFLYAQSAYNKGSRNDGRNDDKRFCTGCNQEGDTVDWCFKKIGYPDWYKGKKGKKQSRMATYVSSGFDDHFNVDTPFDMGNGNEIGTNSEGSFD
nr:hypothetical protein [Tanacetum cinerariifolium]